jgi:dolichol-phosphate mannosyltransferase
MDADGSHAPEFIHNLWAERGKYDIVIASRYVEGGYTENSAPLRLMSRVLNWTYSLILNLPYKDVSNSFKLYRGSLLKGLKLRCDNFDIVEEILYKIVRLNPGLPVKEIPFSFKKRMFGETKRSLLLFIFTYLVTMIRLRLTPLK